MANFDDLLDELGSFGPFQLRLFLLVNLLEVPAAWLMFQPVFTAAKPAWACPGAGAGNGSEGAFANTTLWACAPDGGVCAGIEYAANFTSISMEWDFVCSRASLRYLITSIQMLGTLVGACIVGQLADTLGRRHVLYTVYFLMLLTGGAAGFATDWRVYAACRCLFGASFGGVMLVNFVLPLEFVGRQWRNVCGCVGFWSVGIMLLAPIAYWLRDWRQLTFFCPAIGSVLLLTWPFVSESPRWLIQKGRVDEAKAILAQMADFNKKPLPDLSKLSECLQDEAAIERKVSQYSYWHLFRTPTMTKDSCIVIFIWFVCCLVYYGTSLNVGSLSGDPYLNCFLSGVVELPALLIVFYLNNRIGRRWTLSLLLMVAGVSSMAFIFLTYVGGVVPSSITTVFALIGKSGISGSWAAAMIFSAEVFPTVVRNIGVGACSMGARIGGIVAPQIIFLSEFSRPLPFLVFGTAAIAGAFLSLLLPETLHQPLADVLPPGGWTRNRRGRRDGRRSKARVENGNVPLDNLDLLT